MVGLLNWPLTPRMKRSLHCSALMTLGGAMRVPVYIIGPDGLQVVLGPFATKTLAPTGGSPPNAGLAISSSVMVISPASVPKASAVYGGTAGQVGPSRTPCTSPLLSGGSPQQGGFPGPRGQRCRGPRVVKKAESQPHPFIVQQSLSRSQETRPFPPTAPGQIAHGHCPAFSAGFRGSWGPGVLCSALETGEVAQGHPHPSVALLQLSGAAMSPSALGVTQNRGSAPLYHTRDV